MSKSGGGNFGIFVVIAILLVAWAAFNGLFGFDPMPILRGMHMGVPLVCILLAAVVIVLWAGKFFDIK